MQNLLPDHPYLNGKNGVGATLSGWQRLRKMKCKLFDQWNRLCLAGAVLITTGALAGAGHAQIVTNAPKTALEVFEAQTGTVIVKGFGQANSVTTSGGTISVRCLESVDISAGTKQYGLEIELAENSQSRDKIIVDYDELDALLNGIDYLSKISYDVTPLPGFEAVYSTKSGLRFEAHSSRRMGGIQTFLKHGDNVRIPLASDQVSQIRDLIGQGRTALTALMTPK